MARFLHHSVSSTFRKYGNWFLAFSWAAGLGFGVLIFRSADGLLVSLMPMAAACHVSIVGLLICTLLPLLFSAFAVYLYLPQLLIPISFCKAALYAYASCAVLAAFGSAGWLVRLLLMFSDTCGAVLLYAYCMRHVSGQKYFSPVATGLYCMAGCMIAGADLSYIAPLLRGVLS